MSGDRGDKRTVYVRTFRVRGSGEFPMDMLRYDSAWPRSEQDANIAQDWPGSADRRGPRFVTLNTISPHAPTERRWESFGWHVSMEPA